MPRGALFQALMWKIHKPSHVFLENMLPILRNVQEKTSWWFQNAPHTLQTEATGKAFQGTAYQPVREECRPGCHNKLLIRSLCLQQWPTQLRSTWADSELCGSILSLLFLQRSEADVACGGYWRKNTAKCSCGSPISKYGFSQPNCSPFWQWFRPKVLSCLKNADYPWGWF